MTTNVIVQAHCDEKTEVVVKETDSPDTVLKDGESGEFVIYDNIEVSVKERPIGSEE